MSEQTETRNKRPRKEEAERKLMTGVNERTSTSTETEVSSESPAVAERAPVESILKKFVMLPSTLQNLLGKQELKVLILDCDINGLRPIKIPNKFVTVWSYVHLDPDYAPEAIKFPTKSSVIGFLQEHCQVLQVYLGTPGHYAKIVVLDWMSTAEECSKPVQILIGALVKWNEKTKTDIQFLQGGMDRFSKEFPSSVVPLSQLNPTVKVTLAHIVPAGSPNIDIFKDEVEEMLCYLKNLDEVIHILRTLLHLKRRLVSLGILKPTLTRELAEEENELNRHLSTLISEDVRCPVCYDVFQAEIFLCSNGHSICSNCCTTLTMCPECRAPYTAGKVRNRALENHLRNWLRVKCVCRVTLELKEVRSHVAICVKKWKGVEVAKLEDDIGAAKQEISQLTVKLGEMNKTISDTEMLWFSRLLDGVEERNVSPEVCSKFSCFKSAKKSTIEELRTLLYNMAHSAPE